MNQSVQPGATSQAGRAEICHQQVGTGCFVHQGTVLVTYDTMLSLDTGKRYLALLPRARINIFIFIALIDALRSSRVVAAAAAAISTPPQFALTVSATTAAHILGGVAVKEFIELGGTQKI